MTRCRDNREFIPEYVDNPDGSRSVKVSNCMRPVKVIDAPATNPTANPTPTNPSGKRP